MKRDLTGDDLNTLQDALAYKLLYLKECGECGLTTELTRCDTLPIMGLAAKLEVLKEKYEDCLELDRIECQVLIGSLDASIRKSEEYMNTHEEDWCAADEEILEYKLKLRSKIKKFSSPRETIDKED